MVESEKLVDQKYMAEGWLPFARGWPDRAYVRMKDGKLEVRLVEIKSPADTVHADQELMHMILRSQGLDVQIEPASKAPRKPFLPLDTLFRMLEALEQQRQIAQRPEDQAT
jgi:hypothetical protein